MSPTDFKPCENLVSVADSSGGWDWLITVSNILFFMCICSTVYRLLKDGQLSAFKGRQRLTFNFGDMTAGASSATTSLTHKLASSRWLFAQPKTDAL